MSETGNVNIVRIGEFGEAAVGHSEVDRSLMVRGCRDTALESLCASLAAMLDGVDDALFEMAEKAESNATQSVYFDTMREVRLKRRVIETGFRGQLSLSYDNDARIKGAHGRRSDDDLTAVNLSLVDDDALEINLAVSSMAAKARNLCHDQLFALDRRFGVMLNDPGMERHENPLRPESICESFKHAIDDLEVGLEAKLVILKLFDRLVICGLVGFYESINEHLAKQNILPEIRVRVKKRPYSAMSYARRAALAAGQSEEEFHSALGQLDAYTREQAIGGQVGMTPIDHGAVINALTRLQQGHYQGLAASQADMDALTAGTVNILRNLKEVEFAHALGKGDGMTLDIVAMLFDYILEDRSIPNVMKALIGRLQIPVLKVAILDKGFFSKKGHPARRLLNLLAHAGLGWTDKNAASDGFFRRIESAVQRILHEFDDNVAIFSEVLEELELSVNAEEDKAEMRAERHAKVVQGGERLELLKRLANEEIRKRTECDGVPDFVRDFLIVQWKDYLLVTVFKQGDDSLAWHRALSVMEELAWCTSAFRSSADAARLNAIRPKLREQLEAGMEVISMHPDYRARFIERLESRLTELSTIAPGERPVAFAESPQAEPANTATLQDGDIPILGSCDDDEQVLVAMAGPGNLVDTRPELGECLAQVKAMSKGDWVEFIAENGDAERAKLTWISPITGLYLFTNRQGLKAADRTPAVLAEDLYDGRARLIEDVPLLDRAVSTLLEGLKKPA
jgi:hypothetical protein